MNIRIVKFVILMSFLIVNAQFAFMQTSPIAPDIQRIKSRGVLIVALHSVDQPPFFFVNKKNELTGLDIEISKGIADGLGVKLKFNRNAKSFNDLIDIVDRGEADIAVSKLSRTLSRAQIIAFSTPYITFRQALILNRLELAKKAPSNEDIVPFIKDFTGKIGVIANSSYVNYAKKNFSRATIVELPTWDDIINAVFKGEILAGYRDEMEIKKIIKGRSDASLKVKSVIIKDVTDPISIAVSRKDTQLLTWINLHLESLNLNLDAEKLLNKYPEIFAQNK
jgi:polar amino acid transport system substrate-binding protein